MAILPSVPTNKNLEILRGKKIVECIGLLREGNEDGDMEYKNIVVTIDDGKLVDVKVYDVSYTSNSAINAATGWIDNHYEED